MNAGLVAKLDQLRARLAELDAQLSDPHVTDDLDKYRRLSREHAELVPVVSHYSDYLRAASDASAARELLTDGDMRSFGEDELRDAQGKMAALEVKLQR